MLCISTSKRVLHMPFAGRNHYFYAKTNFTINFCCIYMALAIMYRNDNCFVILMSGVYFGDWVTKIWHFSPLKTINSVQLRTAGDLLLHVFVQLSFHFSLFCSVSDGKSCFNVKKIDFNQQTACGAPVCWLKYTTLGIYFLSKDFWQKFDS